jgi:hypothetical protein
MRLDPKHYTLGQLLQGRLFRIPDYQRPYAWGKKQRDELFSDINEVYETKQEHFMATVVALAKDKRIIVADEYVSVDLVDGQQRITTLIVLFKAIEQALDESNNNERRIKEEIKELLVKSDDYSLLLLQTNHDSSNVFADYIRKGEYKAEVDTTEAEKNLIDACIECHKFVEAWGEDKSLVELVSILKNRLSMIYHELTEEASVYRVFEVLNSRGLDVKWVDKLKSQLMGLLFAHAEKGALNEALDEMREIWRRIYRIVGLRSSLADEAMRFAGTLYLKTAPGKILSQGDASAEMAKAAGTEVSSIIKVARYLETVVKTIDELDKNHRIRAVMNVMQARFVAVCIAMRNFHVDDHKRVMKTWEHISFLIYVLGGIDKRKKVGEYTKLAYEIIRKEIEPDLICKRLLAIPDAGQHVEKALKEFDASDCYNGWEEPLRYILFRYEEHLAHENGQKINASEWNKIWMQDPSKSIEHIKPQSSGVNYMHHLGNLAMLPPGVNSSLKDKSPVEKVGAYESSGIRSTRDVAKAIRDGGWSFNNVKTRAADILEFVRREWTL